MFVKTIKNAIIYTKKTERRKWIYQNMFMTISVIECEFIFNKY